MILKKCFSPARELRKEADLKRSRGQSSYIARCGSHLFVCWVSAPRNALESPARRQINTQSLQCFVCWVSASLNALESPARRQISTQSLQQEPTWHSRGRKKKNELCAVTAPSNKNICFSKPYVDNFAFPCFHTVDCTCTRSYVLAITM